MSFKVNKLVGVFVRLQNTPNPICVVIRFFDDVFLP